MAKRLQVKARLGFEESLHPRPGSKAGSVVDSGGKPWIDRCRIRLEALVWHLAGT
jgi:hypothetical protein